MNKDLQKLIESFYEINGKINKQKNRLISFEGTEPLNTASIHLIDVIGKHPDYNVTKIARVLGNTKGAVSQMVLKLENKGLIKRKNGTNEKEITFVLTQEGKKVFEGHEQLHAQMYERLEDLLNEFSKADVKKIQKAFDVIDECMDEYGHL